VRVCCALLCESVEAEGRSAEAAGGAQMRGEKARVNSKGAKVTK